MKRSLSTAVYVVLALISYSLALNCPECAWTIEALVKNNGYTLETHKVITIDGFVLTMHRIPEPRHSHPTKPTFKPAVLLQHGLMDSSAGWLLNMPGQSLAYILADAGYDVWMGNNRGNTYSPPPPGHWNFSFDEMAEFDVPAQVNHVLQHTGRDSLTYIGHSQGCTQMFANLASSSHLHHRINLFIALDPVVYAGHIRSFLLKLMAKLGVDRIWELGGDGEFGKNSRLYRYVAEIVCNGSDPNSSLCDWAIFSIIGSDNMFPNHNLNNSRFSLYAAHYPAGTSIQNIRHWVQHISTDKFQHFDYGHLKNLWKYGHWNPPAYNLSNVNIPLAVFSGTQDTLADPTDVWRLLSELRDLLVYSEKTDGYNHLDALLGMNANKLLYPNVLWCLGQYNLYLAVS